MGGRFLSPFAFLLMSLLPAAAQQAGTIHISDLYTTHLIFDTEIKYGDLSNTSEITATVVERSRNMLAITALSPFEKSANVTVLESNGNIHTFIVEYDEHPGKLLIDMRAQGQGPSRPDVRGEAAGSVANTLWREDAPPLRQVLDYPQGLYHLAAVSGRVTLVCENIFSYSDITYVVLSIDNRSGVSFEVSDATFRVEPRDSRRRRLVNGSNILPQNKEGSLTAAAGGRGRVAYALDKLTLSDDQILVVDVYESHGQRHLEMTVPASDVNLATVPKKR